MRKIYLLICICVFVSGISFAQQRKSENRATTLQKKANKLLQRGSFQIDANANVENFIKHNLFGKCAIVSNIMLNTSSINKSPQDAVGVFVDSAATVGMTSGLLLTTGSAYLAEGPNNSSSAGEVNNLLGDSLAETLIPGYTTYDATILEFDFVPLADSILAFEFVFGSEEYPEFVGSSFNDVFGFFLSGPGLNGQQNLALIPGTTIPIAINNVNDTTYGQYYISNDDTASAIQYDGYTTVFQIVQPVTPLETYHYKIVIADAGDQVFDSGVFLSANSFYGLIDSVLVDFNYSIDSTMKSVHTVHFTNLSSGATEFNWDFGDGATSTLQNPSHTYTADGNYNVTLNGDNYCYNGSVTASLALGSVNINEQMINHLQISSLENGLFNIAGKLNSVQSVIVRLYNLNGQMILSDQFETSLVDKNIDIRNLAQGIYQLQISTSSETITKKIVH